MTAKYCWLLACGLAACGAPGWTQTRTFVCGAGRAGVTSLQTDTRYAPDHAGFDLSASPGQADKSGCTSATAFFFSAPSEEGNYRVTVVLGGEKRAVTTVRAEARRVMLLNVSTEPGRERSETFIVNVRRPEIAGEDAVVKRKPREMASLDWDEKLTLEFAGVNPSVRSIAIEKVEAPTIFLAGDSTVVDQDNEPWAAWGQMLPLFLDARIAVANHAESGETIRSFESERRFAKIFSQMRKGDFLLMQFAHNDMKKGAGYVPPEMYEALLTKYIGMARERGATPVLVTSMNRRTFDADGKVTDSLAPYPDTMRAVAREQHVALIDLNAMSKTLYEALGAEGAKALFVYAAANTYPNQTEALHDDTHFNSYGAYEIARCVVLGLEHVKSPLAAYLRKPVARFDPATPDPRMAFPASPFVDMQKPYER